MNKIKAILVDDESAGLIAMRKLLELHAPQVAVAGEAKNAASAKQLINTVQPDVVFLDIGLPGKNGIELLAELKQIQFEIIFITAHNQYVLQALRYSAVDYLLKPVDEDELLAAVEKLKIRLQQKNQTWQYDVLLHNMQQSGKAKEMKICLPTFKGFQVVELEQIIYCEAASNYTNFHIQGRPVICVSKTLIEFEESLADAGFLRVHKSYIVNLRQVREYKRGEGGTIIMNNGDEIEVSRRRKDLFLEKVKEFFRY